jgi:hypothetical protein
METMEQIDHPPGHEIERLNQGIERQYGDDDVERWNPLDWVIPSDETAESHPEDDSTTSSRQPELTGAEMMQRDPDLTGADVLEI